MGLPRFIEIDGRRYARQITLVKYSAGVLGRKPAHVAPGQLRPR
jgi:hypothetical protein